MKIRENELHDPIIEQVPDINKNSVKRDKEIYCAIAVCPVCKHGVASVRSEHSIDDALEEAKRYSPNYCRNCGARLKEEKQLTPAELHLIPADENKKLSIEELKEVIYQLRQDSCKNNTDALDEFAKNKKSPVWYWNKSGFYNGKENAFNIVLMLLEHLDTGEIAFKEGDARNKIWQDFWNKENK